MRVKEIMSATAETIDPEASLMDAAKAMRDRDVGSLPVIEAGRLIGIVTDRDIACRGVAEDLDPANTPVRRVMTSEAVWCSEDQDVEDAAHVMEDHQVHRLPVVDSDGNLVGMLSVDDLAQRAAHALSGEVLARITRRHKGRVVPRPGGESAA